MSSNPPTPQLPNPQPTPSLGVVGLWAFLDPSLLSGLGLDAVSTLLAGTAAAAGLGLVVTSQAAVMGSPLPWPWWHSKMDGLEWDLLGFYRILWDLFIVCMHKWG